MVGGASIAPCGRGAIACDRAHGETTHTHEKDLLVAPLTPFPPRPEQPQPHAHVCTRTRNTTWNGTQGGMTTCALGELSGVSTDRLHSPTPLLTSQVHWSTPYCDKGHLAASAARRFGGCMSYSGLECTRLSFAALGVHISNGFQCSGPLAERAVSDAFASTGLPRNVRNGAFRRPCGGHSRRFPRWPQRQSFGIRVEHAWGAAGRIF